MTLPLNSHKEELEREALLSQEENDEVHMHAVKSEEEVSAHIKGINNEANIK